MALTETEKETLAFLLKAMETTQFDWDDSIERYIDLEQAHDPGVMTRRIKRLAKKGILESAQNDQIGLRVGFTFKKLLLAYNGIFIDTLTDHLGEEYRLDIYSL